MSDGSEGLLEALLREAFEHFAHAIPTVVSAEMADEVGPDTTGRYEMPFSWPRCIVGSPGELESAVAERLADGPVLLMPPWGRSRTAQIHPLTREHHEAVLLRCNPAGPDSLLGVLVPTSTWALPSAPQVREELANRWKPVLLIYADNGSDVFPDIHSSFQFTAVFLRPREIPDPLLRIFRVPPRPDGALVTEDFRRLLKRGGGRGQFGYVLRDLPPPGDSLAFDRHDPAVNAKRAELSVLGAAVAADEIFDRVRPGIHVNDDRDRLHAEAVNGAIRVIKGRDLRSDGTLAPADDSVDWACVPPDRELMAGDIILPEILGRGDRGGLRAVELADSDLPAAASNNIVTLRPKRALSHAERVLILSFLRSQLARDLADAATGGAVHLTWSALRELPVPQPDEVLTAALDDLDKAATLFETWRSEAPALLESVFTDDSAASTRARIVGTGRITRLRSDAAALLDDAAYTFRTRFPYPVAYRWREVEAAVSAREFITAYRAIVESAEVMLCYVANVGLAVSRVTGIPPRDREDDSRQAALRRHRARIRGLDHGRPANTRQQSSQERSRGQPSQGTR